MLTYLLCHNGNIYFSFMGLCACRISIAYGALAL